jgi:hypothetical protein
MRWTLAVSAILLAALANEPRAAWGQMSGMTTSSGTFGSQTFGSGMSSSGLGSSFGSFGSSMGSGIGGMGMGSSGIGGMSSGIGGFGSQTGIGSAGSGVGGQSSFVGVNQQQLTGRGFIGATQANNTGMGQGTTGLGGGMQGLGTSGMQGLGSSMPGLGNGSSSMYPNGSQQYPNGQDYTRGNGATTIRTTLTVGFDNRSVAAPRFNSAVATRLAGLPAIHWRSQNQVEMRGRTAILRGVVATEHDRDLAERVARLEAAVDQVDNQLVVASSSTKPAKPSATAAGAAGKSAASH